MRTYLVLTAIHGLPRAEPWFARTPIATGEVILLPDDVAAGLLQISAIEPSDAAETCLLDFDAPAPPAMIASDDVDGLIAAVRNVGGVAKIIAAADVDELRAALERLPEQAGAVLPAPVEADPEDMLRQVSNFALLSEVHARIEGDALTPYDLLAVLPPDASGLARLSAGIVEAGVISAEAAAAPAADPVGVALSALKARGEEIARLNAELSAVQRLGDAPALQDGVASSADAGEAPAAKKSRAKKPD